MVKLSDTPNVVDWKWTADRKYSVKSASQCHLLERTETNFVDTNLFDQNSPQSNFFAWLAAQGKCLMPDNLAKRCWPHTPTCPLCNLADETPSHLFLSSQYTTGVWAFCSTRYLLPCPVLTAKLPPISRIGGSMSYPRWATRKTRIYPLMFMMILWQVLKERNVRTF